VGIRTCDLLLRTFRSKLNAETRTISAAVRMYNSVVFIELRLAGVKEGQGDRK
jgi:hypothetical protein